MSEQLSENSAEKTEIVQEPNFEKKQKKSFLLKMFFIGFSLMIIIGIIVAAYYYNIFYGNQLPGRDKDVVVQIKSGSNLEQITDLLIQNGIVKDKSTFKWVCSIMKYKGKSGQYRIPQKVTSYHALVAILRAKQVPVKLTFNNFRLLPQLAAHISRYIEADSLSLIAAMTATDFLDVNGLKPESAMTLFIPNSYQMYWDTDAASFVKKMQAEHKKFWDSTRLEKAKKINLSPAEVYTLASIVDAETTYVPEKKRVAGVYLNRLKTKGWKLEADPTVVFAGGDFTVRRVTNDLLKINSPYNTYQNAGLPPGPIRMASVSAIDAVLDAEVHDYMFFCAKVPEPGQPAQHAFARNGAEHGNNARLYRQWLNSQKIYK
jgi:UPF0755 protein